MKSDLIPSLELDDLVILLNLHTNLMTMILKNFTALIEKSDDGWYVGQLEEMPEVLSQGKTVKELMINLKDALSLFLQTQKEETAKNYNGKKYIRRKLSIA